MIILHLTFSKPVLNEVMRKRPLLRGGRLGGRSQARRWADCRHKRSTWHASMTLAGATPTTLQVLHSRRVRDCKGAWAPHLQGYMANVLPNPGKVELRPTSPSHPELSRP
ncbi:hypothetical protein COCOBI_06-5700 [Coccomyxa sp. Obi]|nr:hypothetical protein COCOBI_06-5700 [Coccomyxa sp. Obi]